LVHFAPWTPNRIGDIDIAPNFGVVRCALEFGLGVLAYGLYAEWAFVRFFDKDLAFVLVAGCILAGMQWRVHDLVTVAAFVLLVLCAAQNHGAAARVLNTRALRLLGDISYSVYMVHMFFRELARMALKRLIGRPLWEVTGPAERVAVLGGLVAIILAASALTWRMIEVPMRERLKPARRASLPSGLVP
jgi:peptidoglycan/LPS O-acetylase OafA/YrhL